MVKEGSQNGTNLAAEREGERESDGFNRWTYDFPEDIET